MTFALPFALIKQLKEHASEVLTERQLDFEKRLRRTAGTGFSNGMPFYEPALDRHHFESGDFREDTIVTLEMAWARQTAAIMTGLEDTPVSPPVPPVEPRLRHAVTRSAEEEQKAYCGWLMCHPPFLEELRQFRQQYPDFVNGQGEWMLSRWEGADTSPDRHSGRHTQAILDCQRLLRRWSLRAIVGFELPIPNGIAVSFGENFVPGEVNSDDLLIRIPAAMRRVARIDLSSVQVQLVQAPRLAHLRPWFSPHDSKLGSSRLRGILDLRIYWQLALQVRYPKACSNNIGALVKAFAAFSLGDEANAESIGKRERTIREFRTMLRQRFEPQPERESE